MLDWNIRKNATGDFFNPPIQVLPVVEQSHQRFFVALIDAFIDDLIEVHTTIHVKVITVKQPTAHKKATM